ncbi:MAG: beta-ketoacyl-[acyl-carrier-protein] synthase II [Nitrospirae bacterium]|nr:MAG: beta-ketoacyl-[acyl-carrier-protein] synthase II [Nitrospirota bacterium]
MRRRVAITGLGIVCPVGIGVEQAWSALLAGRSGIRRVTRIDPSDYPCQIAGEVEGFDPDTCFEKREQKKVDLFIQFGMAAAIEAMADAGLTLEGELADRAGVCVGSGIGGLTTIEHYGHTVHTRGPRRITPFFIPMSIINLVAGHISIRFNARGPNTSPVTACATGTHAIGDGARMIQYGEADVMICGGAEAPICRLGLGGFGAMKALSTRNEEPERASRPFDAERDGFVMGEGAGILVLEEMEHARRRGARIYAEVVGYGMSGDAHHITAPAPEGEGAQRCMRATLRDAGLAPEAVGYINAHGTSTPANDRNESRAIRAVFGGHADRLVVSSTKSMTGHLLGAAGGIEGVFLAKAVAEQRVPPTINYEHPDPECDLDYCPNEARDLDFEVGMSNSFGFGGTNACVAFRRV